MFLFLQTLPGAKQTQAVTSYQAVTYYQSSPRKEKKKFHTITIV